MSSLHESLTDSEQVGKGKEVIENENDGDKERSGESEELEGSEVEDVVKGPEISTLDVDKSMEVEK